MYKLILILNLFFINLIYCQEYPEKIEAKVEERNNKLIINILKTKKIEILYIVKKGDTLNKIAKKYNKNIYKIAKDNNIKNINIIQQGVHLVIK